MSFRFALESILHFRQSVEHQQELALRTANQKVAKMRYLIDQLDELIRNEQVLSAGCLTAGTTAAELHFALARADSLSGQRTVLEREMSRALEVRDQQQQMLREARQKREVLESVRTHQLREYQQDARRREQRQLDDLFLLQQNCRRRG